MVQMFYYENRGKCCRKLWKHNGSKTLKVYLHLEDSWAETSGQSVLLIRRRRHWQTFWPITKRWKGERVTVVLQTGTVKQVGTARMTDNYGNGTLWIRGKFKDKDKEKDMKKMASHFKLTLTSHVSVEDFHLGYCLSGVLERSAQKYSPYTTTHLAFVKRPDNSGQKPLSKAQQRPHRDLANLLNTAPEQVEGAGISGKEVEVAGSDLKEVGGGKKAGVFSRLLRRLCTVPRVAAR